ncbi:homoserine kinase [Altererythrobacter sp. ZODW24]|uniref:homoserine kinase n=1 Tax=Altererythrobacter sp. ZODW24 TaxID=2185142 RepID=UPI000DF7229E|nr:homoserine kinase [Altererythrobacter sp. ZODW24]
MAVYTNLGAEDLSALIAHYDVGTLQSAKGIAEGVSNSNWLIETSKARYILTMYERRIETSDLPFFLGLLDHLAAANCPVPRTIHDREGAAYRMIGDKAVALIEFLPGVSPDQPSAEQARSVGAALAEMHLAAQNFPLQRVNALGPESWTDVLEECGADALAGIDPALPATIGTAREVATNWPAGLPETIIHSDLFPDNVLMLDGHVTGMIDFYFACTGAAAYDLAVTHAAWCFTSDGSQLRPEISAALIAGYESHRPLQPAERAALPLLAQGACLRFISSRAADWLEMQDDALVCRKNPIEFVKRLSQYSEMGSRAFQ